LVNDDYSRSSLGSDCEYYYSQHAATIDNVNHQEFVLDLSFGLIRRLFDILVGSLGLLCSVPFIVVFGLLTKIEDGGPVFYKQERVGLYGKHFTLYKLRSMRVNAEKNGPQWAEKDDPRVTRVGSFIRKTRIDELPQFYNVLRGDMTLVGPRPERPEFVIRFDQEIPGFISRLQVKPGLTGWAQINGGYDITPKEKLELDLFYIENRSLLFNMRILIKTVLVLFTGSGAR
jgi:exopolysaccharide biosynthesis polyprenyl glycosylphosphotransferase